MGRILALVFFILSIINFSYTQTDQLIESRINQELAKRGIEESEVKVRLLKRGYNPDNIKPSDLPKYRSVLEEIIKEIEAEKNNVKKLNKDSKEDSKEGSKKDSKRTTENQKTITTQKPVEKVTPVASAPKKVSKSPIYGHHIFENNELTVFNSSNNSNATSNYVISTGDEVRISIFGASQAEFQFIVDDNGEINATKVGKIYIRGLKLSDARKLVRNRFSRKYRFLPEQFLMNISSIRTVTIEIFGEVGTPGTYTISANNSALNAIMAAGGITNIGSVRNIKLIKALGETKIIDIYEYLVDPKLNADFRIDDRDIIYVPIAQNIVQIEGAIRRPMKYELKKNDTPAKLIEYAGGFLFNSNQELLKVTRQVENERKVLDVRFKSNFAFKDNDLVTIKGSNVQMESFVQINGEVKYAGKYAYKEGLTLAQVLQQAELTPFSKRDAFFVFRKQNDGTVKLNKYDLTSIDPKSLILNNQDVITFYSIKEFVDKTKNITSSGAIRKPADFVFNPSNEIRLSDLIVLSGGLKENASPNAIIKRKVPDNNQEVKYIEVNVFDAIANAKTDKDLILVEGDALVVYQNERYNQIGTVSIVGEVMNPETFQYNPSLTLRDVLLLAGGLKEQANSTAMIKRSAQDNNKEVSYLRVDLTKVLSGEEDVELLKGDEIRVYNKSQYLNEFKVQVYGEVNNPGSFAYDQSLSLEDLIYMSGGLSLKAASSKVEIYRLSFSEENGTKTLIKEIGIEKVAYDKIKVKGQFQLEPYDIVIVRPVADFELQEVVYITGQVKFPGPYILTKNDERLKDIVKRAGGLKYDAFPSGATLVRKTGEKQGDIFINLDKAMSGFNNYENIVVRNGDMLFVPKKENVITIYTNATKADIAFSDLKRTNDKIQISFQGRKSAKWYINQFAGGLNRKADKYSIRVVEPSGRINSTKRYLGFIYNYPDVVEGASIYVDLKEPKPAKEKREPINWTQAITDSMAILTSAVTIVVLALQLKG